jgi:alpha-mannosidase
MKRINEVIHRLPRSVYRTLGELNIEAWVTPEPVTFADRTSGEYKKFNSGESWGKLWDCAWFHFTGFVPESAAGENVTLLIDLSGEGCVFDPFGNPVQGLTSVSSGFDLSLGAPGKRVVPFISPAKGGETIDLWVDAGCNDLFGGLQNAGTIQDAKIAARDDELQALCFDFEVLRELLDHLPAGKARLSKVVQALYDAVLLLTEPLNPEKVKKARAILAPELARRGGDPSLTISAVGHAHIDLAWLWPLRETIRKGARTFSTVLHLMDRYPDYVFGASQPQLYEWMKTHYPELYKNIQKRVHEGRWEVQGAMWVEPDANIPSGESLVRQILYGKRFFRDEFGVDVKNLWLPDVFGYSGSIPQILRKSGVDYFMTQKLSWSEFNTFPHHTFHWEGIDFSEVLVHMPPESTYNSSVAPRSIARAENDYLDKNVSDECLVLFGIGDGGGGPGEEHLERLSRERDLQGLVPVIQEPAEKLLEKLSKNSDKYASWRGELYLEKHQGTFTTQARNKRFNRKMELALREFELSAVRAMRASEYAYPSAEIDNIWKEMLLYQFHDILPGSSITRVYDESRARYQEMLDRVSVLTSEADQAWINSNGATSKAPTALNSLSWRRSQWVKRENGWVKADVDALSSALLPSPDSSAVYNISASIHKLENSILRVEFNDSGDITSIFDKENGRETLKKGQIGNHLSVYDDKGDAWDFPADYREARIGGCELLSSEAHLDGPQAIVAQTRQFGTSVVTQRIILADGGRRIDFETHVDWKEDGKMLRVNFPVAVRSDIARCEIQFGNIARPTTQNTTWEAAKFEICGHKWVDISEQDYGVALLNDCKYGHCVHGSVLDLNLLRSPSYPDPSADRAEHDFTYSLYPHAGDYIQGNVVRAGYELNVPLRIVDAGETIDRKPFLQVDSPNVVVETVKKAEDSRSVIVRLYEASGASADASIRLGFFAKEASIVDLMEENDIPISIVDSSISVHFKPFEIITLKIG